MKRFLILLACLFTFVSLTACDSLLGSDEGNDKIERPDDESEDENRGDYEAEDSLKAIYVEALKAGFDGDYEDFLESLRGDKIELRVNDGQLEWKYSKASSWKELVSLKSLAGSDGRDGKDGRDIELRVTLTYIEWRYKGDNVWKKLIPLDKLKGHDGDSAYDVAVDNGFRGNVSEWLKSLKGQDGEAGADGQDGQDGHDGKDGQDGKNGREVEFRVTLEAIEWHYVGDEDYKVLVTLESLKGKNGLSPYEIAVENGFEGDVTKWLESLKGKNGKDGREVEFRVSLTHIEWHYKDEDSWTKLVNLDSLKGKDGEDGINGADGLNGLSAYEIAVKNGFKGDVSAWLDSLKGQNAADAREVEFRVTLTHIEWRYVGDSNWTRLISLDSLKGKDGTNGTDGKDGQDGANGQDGTNGKDGAKGESAYEIAVKQGFKGTVSQWLESLKGQNGSNGLNGLDGREVEFRVTLTHIEWHYKDEGSWTQLISLDSLKGQDVEGESAYDIAVKNGFEGDVNAWLDSLKGQNGKNGQNGHNGADGADGREVEFRVFEENIEWHYVGDENWNFLISLESIKGNNGKSAYEIYCEKHPEYQKTEDEWLDDLVNGKLGKAEKFTVKFVTGTDLVIEDQVVNKFEKVTKPEEPLKAGYKFLGWYIDDEKWVFSGFLVTENLTLTAKYEAIAQDVIIDLGDLQVNNKYHINETINLEKPHRDGFVFDKWINAQGEEIKMPYTITGPETITASWRDYILISFDSCGGNVLEPIQVLLNAKNVNLPMPVKQGSAFAGWYLDDQEVLSPFDNTFTYDLKLTAHYIADNSNVEYVTLPDGTIKLVKYLGTENEIKLPDSIDGKKITVLGTEVIKNRNATKVTLGRYVTTLEDKAFAFLRKLVEINFNDELKNYGENALYQCNQITTMRIVNNVTLMGLYGYDATKVPDTIVNFTIIDKEEVNAPIYNMLFKNIKKSSDMPEIFITINLITDSKILKDYQFYNMVYLKKVVLPDSIEIIGSHAFDKCSVLESVNMPQEVIEIKDYAFDYTKLNSLNLSKKTVRIGDHAVKGHIINTNEVLEYIGKDNFRACDVVYLPKTIKFIDGGNFKDTILSIYYGGSKEEFYGIDIRSSTGLENTNFYNCKVFYNQPYKEMRIESGSFRDLDNVLFETKLIVIDNKDAVLKEFNTKAYNFSGLLDYSGYINSVKEYNIFGIARWVTDEYGSSCNIPKKVTAVHYDFNYACDNIYYSGSSFDWLKVTKVGGELKQKVYYE